MIDSPDQEDDESPMLSFAYTLIGWFLLVTGPASLIFSDHTLSPSTTLLGVIFWAVVGVGLIGFGRSMALREKRCLTMPDQIPAQIPKNSDRRIIKAKCRHCGGSDIEMETIQ